jgi:hypothetical protein
MLSCDDNFAEASLPQPLIKPAADPAPNTLIKSLLVKAISAPSIYLKPLFYQKVAIGSVFRIFIVTNTNKYFYLGTPLSLILQ